MAGPARAEENEKPLYKIDHGLDVQRYEWQEFGANNAGIVDETGYMYAFTCDFDSQREVLGWRNGIKLFVGKTNYNGQTWDFKPVKTDGLYLGTQLYMDLVPNYRLNCGLRLKTFGGIGFRGWLRDLSDTRAQDGTSVKGTQEWWGSVYGRAGVGASYPLSKAIEIFSEAGSKIPIYTVNHALVSGSPSVNLTSKQRFSPFIDFGVHWKKFTAKLSYDTFWIGKSDTVKSGPYSLYQPKSEADIISLNIAWEMLF